MKQKKLFKVFLIFIGVVMLSATGYIVGQTNKETKRYSNDIIESSLHLETKTGDTLPEEEFGNAILNESDIDTSSWKVYRNEKYGFEIRYPEHWRLVERQDLGELNMPVISLKSERGGLPPVL